MVFEAGNASKITRINPALEKLWKSCYRRPRPNIPIHYINNAVSEGQQIEPTAQHISYTVVRVKKSLGKSNFTFYGSVQLFWQLI